MASRNGRRPPDPRKVPKSNGRRPSSPVTAPKQHGKKPAPPPRHQGGWNGRPAQKPRSQEACCPMVAAVRSVKQGRYRLARRYAAMSVRLMWARVA